MTGSRPLVDPLAGLSTHEGRARVEAVHLTESALAGGHVQRLLTVEDAAKLLSTTPTALRARCRRRARRVGREIVARLGAGVVAFKFGASWRLRIEPP